MTRMKFNGYRDYENGKMAICETVGSDEIPVNIFIDNAEEYAGFENGLCLIDVCGVGSNYDVFPSEEAYLASEHKMAPISMIPMGTFPLHEEDEDFEPSPHILFSGKVLDVDWNEDAEPEGANCCLLIETLGLTFHLYTRCGSDIAEGYYIHGVAWLFGRILEARSYGPAFLREYRANRDAWLPMVDHAEKGLSGQSAYGEHNVGWSAGAYDEVRPFFAECWAEDGVTVLTVYISALGMEDATADELVAHLEEIGWLTCQEGSAPCECLRYEDKPGNVFHALNIRVGDEEKTYIEGAVIYSYSMLNPESDLPGQKGTINEGNGVFHRVSLTYPCSEERFEEIRQVIACLRELEGEYLVVDLKGYPQNLRFIQACAYDGGQRFVAEVALGDNGSTDQIFRREDLTRTGLLRAFKTVCLKAEIPQSRQWKDVTEEVFPPRKNVEGTGPSWEETKAARRPDNAADSGPVDIIWRNKDYTARLVFNRLPASGGQMEALHRLVDDLQNRQDVALVIALTGRDDPQEMLVSFAGDGRYYMELSFPMGDFDWAHPLLLANDRLSPDQVRDILTAILVEMQDTGDIDVIGEEFHEINSAVFGKI